MRGILLETLTLALLALGAGLASNRLAGPTRRLTLLEREVKAPVQAPSVARPADITPAPKASPVAVEAPRPTPRTARAPSAPAPGPSPRSVLLERCPRLQEVPQADIGGDDALWLHQRGATFVDARRSAQFLLGHVPGSRSLPAWEEGLAEQAEALALGADLDLPVVIYCSGGDCQDSHLVAQKLWLAGFRNLRIYVDGFPDWERRGLPVATGAAR
ncbi:MAG: hypothetical protein HY823_15370 [Acidobacteria bacterium]|nr:hypothetical protein [Acidobacteriota bacterium]